MGQDKVEPTSVEAAVKHCYSTWSESYYRDYYQSSDAYPPVHTKVVRDQLQAGGARSVLDAGCGPASMLRDLDGLGLDRYGFDLTPEMVVEARRVLDAQGVGADHIWEGSVLDAGSFLKPASSQGFDAAICFGVLPHIPAETDATVLANLTKAVRPGGLVLVEARNQLFSLFTLNRYSRDFFRDTLVDTKTLKQLAGDEAVEAAFAELDQRFRTDIPAIRTGKADEPGYDEVLSRTHNPFELMQLGRDAGLEDVQVLFYHYHCLPPMLEHHLPQAYRQASVHMEDPHDWRGHFLASAFILAGRRRAE